METLKSLVLARKTYDVMRFSIEVDLFTILDKAVTTEQLAEETGMDQGFLTCLLAFLSDTKYVRKADDTPEAFVNTPVSSQYLSRASPAYIGEDIFNEADAYEILAEGAAGYPVNDEISKDFWNAEFVRTIGSKSLLGLVQATASCVNLEGRKRLLDVGGGHGLYSIYFTIRNPGLEAWVLDLHAVVNAARENIEKFRKSDRVHVVEADHETFNTALKYDAVFYSNFIGSAGGAAAVAAKAYEVLEDNGLLVIRNHVYDIEGDPHSSLVVLDRYARRKTRGIHSGEIVQALENHGFKDIAEVFRGDGVVILQGIKKN